MKATTSPRLSKKISCPENPIVVLYKSYPVAANIVGTASKKENSIACFLSNPLNIPPTIVAAALDTPGIMEIL